MLRTTDDIYGLQAAVLRTLASPRRLEIVHLLGRGPLEVHELADELGIGQSNVSAHLRRFVASGSSSLSGSGEACATSRRTRRSSWLATWCGTSSVGAWSTYG